MDWAIETKGALKESLGTIARVGSLSHALKAQGWL